MGLIIVLLALTISFLLAVSKIFYDNKYCNGRYNKKNTSMELNLPAPEWEVTAIEQVSCRNLGPYICKYTLTNLYLYDKHKVNQQTLIVFGAVGMYYMGDKLKLEKV